MFEHIEAVHRDAPLLTLPDTDAVRDYLVARFVTPERAADIAARLPAPLEVTKRGVLVRAHR